MSQTEGGGGRENKSDVGRGREGRGREETSGRSKKTREKRIL